MINGNTNSNSYKIGVFGLDNAGKTTIVKIIQGEQKLGILATLQPTIRVQIEKLAIKEAQWVIWDFGGQASYRDEYLKSPQEFFDGLDLMIYVIDIQDAQRFDLSLKFFDDCLILHNKYSPGKPAIAFLHKMDPDLVKNQQFANNLRYLHRSVLKIARDRGSAIRIWSSTIFDTKLRLMIMIGGSVPKPISSKKTMPQFIQEAKKTYARLSTTTSFESQLMAVTKRMEQEMSRDQKLKQLSLERKRFIEEIKSALKNLK